MKKLLALLLAAVMVFGLMACASSGSSKAETTAAAETTTAAAETTTAAAGKTTAAAASGKSGGGYKIGVSMDDLATEFWMANYKAMEDHCKELGYECVQVVANGDSNTQNEQVSDLIAQGCDAIIICAADSAAIETAIKSCKDAKIPVIMNNRSTTGSAVPDAQVLSDNKTMAHDQMKWFIDYCKKNNLKFDHCLQLIGDLGDQNAIDRHDGYNAAIKEAGDGIIKVSAEVNTQWDAQVALAGLQNAFQADPDINMIILPSDFLWTPVQSALQEANKWHKIGEDGNVACISFDGDVNGMQMLYDGYNYTDAAQAAAGTGVKCVDLCKYFIEGGAALGTTVDEVSQWDPGIIVTIDNYDQVKKDVWGYVGVKETK